ncbi:MAG: fused MFS/spermidine synthase [Myxococcota bacterium]|nr:fused MFS/spermidine synthase [Myxococcota bacterium]
MNEQSISLPRSRERPSWFLAVTVFTCGMAVMIIEMAASRLIAPYYGTSLPVWTALIGTLLIFLSVGYTVGGRIADRHPRPEVLYRIIAAAGACTVLLPFIARPVLMLSMNAVNVSAKSYLVVALVVPIVVTVLLVAAPVTALGCVSPFALRLSARSVEGMGRIAGRLSAISNAGSILGTFLPVFLLIPFLGTKNTFIVAGALLLVVAGIGAARIKLLALAMLALVPAVGITATVKPSSGLIYETESNYHYIQVLKNGMCGKDDEQGVKLYLNEGHSVHSSYCSKRLWLGRYWDWFSMAPFAAGNASKVNRVLIIGLACGTMAQQYKELFPSAEIDGVEIDGKVLEVCRRSFHLNDFVSRERQFELDGRTFLYREEAPYDVIIIDAFRQPYIPFHLTTSEFFMAVKSRLAPDGAVVMNVNRVKAANHQLAQRVLSTIHTALPHTLTFSTDKNNDIIIASAMPLDPETTLARMEEAPSEAARRLGRKARSYARYAAVGTAGFNAFVPAGAPLTDDRAPVEALWDGMFLSLAQKE